MALDLTSFDPVLKHHYSKRRIYELADIKSPFLGLVPKDPTAGGKFIIQPVDYELPQGGSASLAKAIANTGASKFEDFIIYRKKNYQVAKVDNETIWASRTDKDAFLPAFKEFDKAFKRAGRRLAIQLFRSGGGAIGRISSDTTLASTTCKLATPADVMNFQVGMILTFDSVDGGGTEHAGTLTITAINREGGSFTTSGNLSGIAGIAVGDYIFAEGDYGACVQGLSAWLPATAPGATAFCGVDRTIDIDRLGGLRRNCLGESLSESLIKGISTIDKHGGSPSHVFMHNDVFSDLLLDLEGKVAMLRSEKAGRARIGFKGVDVTLGGHDVTLYKDPNCPSNVIYILQLDTWTLYSAGPTPMFLNRTGLLMQGATSDDYEGRVGGYQNLGCSAPGYNLVCVLDA